MGHFGLGQAEVFFEECLALWCYMMFCGKSAALRTENQGENNYCELMLFVQA